MWMLTNLTNNCIVKDELNIFLLQFGDKATDLPEIATPLLITLFSALMKFVAIPVIRQLHLYNICSAFPKNGTGQTHVYAIGSRVSVFMIFSVL